MMCINVCLLQWLLHSFFNLFFFLEELYSALPRDQALDQPQIPVRAGWMCKRSWLQLGGVWGSPDTLSQET